jgi:FtsP/CotA-like multicopper oxidase with cupredoxin domain
MSKPSAHRLGIVVIVAFLLTVAVIFGQTPAPAPTPATPTTVIGTFVNPAEVASHDGKLKAVVLLNDADRNVPNGGKKHLRYFQGWDYETPTVTAPANVSTFTPGPTLRARVGEKVELMFLNTVDDDNFAYTFVTDKQSGAYGCDQASNLAVYPGRDKFPNCFHGSSTANLHFHGFHVTPNAVGDNVLVQVMPVKKGTQDEWKKTIQEVFDMPAPPSNWSEMPKSYRDKQKALVEAKDKDLWKTDEQQISLGQWPQYLAGAFPNYFEITDQDKNPNFKAGQAPGTQWYHAHKHGSTALHMLNGLAGAFIIEGKYDDFIRDFYHLPRKYDEKFEKVFVLQLINPDLDLERTRAKGPGTTLVNGMNAPTLLMKPGEVQLWRFVNATNGSLVNGIIPIGPTPFGAPTFAFRQTAMDGVQLSPANYVAQSLVNTTGGIVLAGGNRTDVLVRAPSTPGTTPFMLGAASLFNVTVTNDAPVNPPLKFPCEVAAGEQPSADCWLPMPGFLNDLPQPKGFPHHVAFGWDAEPGRIRGGRVTSSVGINLPPKFTIDNHQFEEFGPLIDQCMPLDDIQDWVLENNTTIAHPFHIHINPFQVLKIETPVLSATGVVTYTTTTPANNFVWQDVVAIPPGVTLPSGQFLAAGRVTIRQRFDDFTGTFVLHCHILAHEDRGMMQLVRIVPANKFPGDCQAAIPHHH